MKKFRIFKNSRVIVTGHTGFKGSWLTAWLKQLGANVMGISLNLPTISKLDLCALQKTFVLYAKLPRHEFKRIKISEQHDEEGDEMFNLLSEEYKDIIQGKVQLAPEIKEYLGMAH